LRLLQEELLFRIAGEIVIGRPQRKNQPASGQLFQRPMHNLISVIEIP
jgi:hypothetical protein